MHQVLFNERDSADRLITWVYFDHLEYSIYCTSVMVVEFRLGTCKVLRGGSAQSTPAFSLIASTSGDK